MHLQAGTNNVTEPNPLVGRHHEEFVSRIDVVLEMGNNYTLMVRNCSNPINQMFINLLNVWLGYIYIYALNPMIDRRLLTLEWGMKEMRTEL